MKYKLNEGKVFSDVTDGIAILIDVETGIYYGLNPVTTSIYENIVSGVDTDELLSELSKIKGFAGDARDKFDAFVNELVSRKFIVEDANASAAASFSFDEYPNEAADLVLNEYQDASELLLADPIHQVKEEEGWKPNKEVLK